MTAERDGGSGGGGIGEMAAGDAPSDTSSAVRLGEKLAGKPASSRPFDRRTSAPG
jgi:hypothetical protein